MPPFSREHFEYTSCYCEENVYKLAEKLATLDSVNDSYAVFISNEQKICPIWCQRAAKAPNEPVCWDYHVIFVGKISRMEFEHISNRAMGSMDDSPTWRIWDLDSTLPFPCKAADYFENAFRPDNEMREALRQNFRVVPTDVFLRTFASDRRHMRNATTGAWNASPPTYPPIRGVEAECGWNLDRFWDMARDEETPTVTGVANQSVSLACAQDAHMGKPALRSYGELLSCKDFRDRFR